MVVCVWQCWCTSAQRWRQAVVDVVLLKRCMTVDGALLQGLALCSHNARRTLKTVGGCIGTRLVPIQPSTSYVSMLQYCLFYLLHLKPFLLSFLLHDAMHKCNLCHHVWCLVTFMHCVKMATDTTTFTLECR